MANLAVARPQPGDSLAAIVTALRHQLVMRAFANDLPVIHGDDAVRALDARPNQRYDRSVQERT